MTSRLALLATVLSVCTAPAGSNDMRSLTVFVCDLFGKPLQATVRVQNTAAGTSYSGPAGSILTFSLPTGQYRLDVRAPGYESKNFALEISHNAIWRPVALRVGQLSPVDIRARLVLQCSTLTSEAPVWFSVYAPFRDDIPLSVAGNAKGRATIDGIEPGKYIVSAFLGGDVTDQKIVNISPEEASVRLICEGRKK